MARSKPCGSTYTGHYNHWLLRQFALPRIAQGGRVPHQAPQRNLNNVGNMRHSYYAKVKRHDRQYAPAGQGLNNLNTLSYSSSSPWIEDVTAGWNLKEHVNLELDLLRTVKNGSFQPDFIDCLQNRIDFVPSPGI